MSVVEDAIGLECLLENPTGVRFLDAQLRAAVVHDELSLDIRLRMHGLVQQVFEGDATDDALAFALDLAHFEAWRACRGVTVEQAMATYADLVDEVSPDSQQEKMNLDGCVVKRRFGEAQVAEEEPLAGMSGLAQRGDIEGLKKALCAAKAFAAQGGYVSRAYVSQGRGGAAYGGRGRTLEMGRGRGAGRACAEVPAWRFAEVDSEGRSPLHWATDRGHLCCVHMLLDARAPADSRDSEGMTPLAYAVVCEHSEIVALLIQAGADVNSTDAAGTTPFGEASASMRELLTKLGAQTI